MLTRLVLASSLVASVAFAAAPTATGPTRRRIQAFEAEKLRRNPAVPEFERSRPEYSARFWQGVIDTLEQNGYRAPVQYEDYRAEARVLETEQAKKRSVSVRDHLHAHYGWFVTGATRQLHAIVPSTEVATAEDRLATRRDLARYRDSLRAASKPTSYGAAMRGRLRIASVEEARSARATADAVIEELAGPRQEVAILDALLSHRHALDLTSIERRFHEGLRDSGSVFVLDKVSPELVRYSLARARLRLIERDRRHFPTIDEAKLAAMSDELGKLETAALSSVYLKRFRSIPR